MNPPCLALISDFPLSEQKNCFPHILVGIEKLNKVTWTLRFVWKIHIFKSWFYCLLVCQIICLFKTVLILFFISLVKPTPVLEMKGSPLATWRQHSIIPLRGINFNQGRKIRITLSSERWGGKCMSQTWMFALERTLLCFWYPQNTVFSLLLRLKTQGYSIHFPKSFWATYLVWNSPLESRPVVGHRHWRVLANSSIFVFVNLQIRFCLWTLSKKWMLEKLNIINNSVSRMPNCILHKITCWHWYIQ